MIALWIALGCVVLWLLIEEWYDEDPAGWIAIFALITLMTWWLMV
jgi:hypothetical protein